MTPTMQILPVSALMFVVEPFCQTMPIKQLIRDLLPVPLESDYSPYLASNTSQKERSVLMFICQSTSYLARISCVLRNVH